MNLPFTRALYPPARRRAPRKNPSINTTHVCKDEKVRTSFSEKKILHDRDFADDELVTFMEGCAMKHQSQLLKSNKHKGVLFVLEPVRPDEKTRNNRSSNTKVSFP
jgi:hypothetical protein